jgi:arachidonate 5-lipoxygenase
MIAPIGLFYLNKDNDLVPVAIQLHQKPSSKNPVYFPNDPKHLWTLAKMFFNMAEAQHHQAFTHLGTF